MPMLAKRLQVAPQLTQSEVRGLKLRAEAEGCSVSQYVSALIIDDLNNGEPVLHTNHRGRKPKSHQIGLSIDWVNRSKMEVRAKAEVRSLSGYVARLVVKDVGN